MLVFDSIIFGYGNKEILRGVYLSVPPNSIVGLFGLNGSGKSTLIKIGAGFLTQNDGNLFIDEKPVPNNIVIERYNAIGYLSQDSFLPKELCVADFLKKCNPSNNHFTNDSLINKVKDQKILSLSGGELRYLEILFLFSLNRGYYLLDEPFTGIEPIFIEKIINLIIEQKEKGKGILITDHYHRYVTEIIDECYLLKEGYASHLDKSNSFRTELFKLGYLAK